MDIAQEFYKNDNDVKVGIEDSLLFFIDYYGEFMKKWRVMSEQHKNGRSRREEAHNELQLLRTEIEHLKATQHEFTDVERVELEEKTTYWVEVREAPVVIYWEGIPMKEERIEAILIKYQPFFKMLESADEKARSKFSKGAKFCTKMATWPVRKMFQYMLEQYEEGEIKDLLSSGSEIANDLPNVIEKKILKTMEVDLDYHIPPHLQDDY